MKLEAIRDGVLLKESYMASREKLLSKVYRSHFADALGGKASLIHVNAPHSGGFMDFTDAFLAESHPGIASYRYSLADAPVNEPFAPILPFLRSYLQGEGIDPAELLQDCKIYPPLRPLFADYLSGRGTVRREDIFIDEIAYEKGKVMTSILDIMTFLFAHKPICIALADFQFAPCATLDLLGLMHRSRLAARMVVILAFDKHSRFSTDEQIESWEGYIADIEERDSILDMDLAPATGARWPHLESLSGDPALLRACRDNLNLLALLDASRIASLALRPRQDAAEEGDQARQLDLLSLQGDSLYLSGQLDNALHCYETILEAAQKGSDGLAISEAYRRMGFCAIYKNDLATASRFAAQSLESADRAGDELQLLKVYFLHFFIGDRKTIPIDGAMYEKLLALAKHHGFNYTYAFCCTNAYVYYPLYNSWDVVMALCEEAIGFAQGNENLFNLAMAYHQKGIIHSFLNEPGKSLEFLSKSEQLRLELGQDLDIIRINNGIGYLHLQNEEYQEAFARLSKSLSVLERIRNYNEIAVTIFNLALLYFLTGNYSLSLDLIEKVLAIMKVIKMTHIPYRSLLSIQVFRGICLGKTGRSTKMLELFGSLRKMPFDLSGDGEFFFRILEGMACGEMGDLAAADVAFGGAVATLDPANLSQRKMLPVFYQEYGTFLKSAGAPEKAERIFEEGIQVCADLGLARHRKWLENAKAGRDPSGDRIVLPPVHQVNLDTLVEIARQEVTLNKFQKKIREIKFLNLLQAQLESGNAKEEIARISLELMHINFPLEFAYLHIRSQGAWVLLHGIGPVAGTEFNLSALVDRLSLTPNGTLTDAKLLLPQFPGLDKWLNSIIDIPIFRRGELVGNVLVATGKPEVYLNPDDLDIFSIAARQVFGKIEFIDKQLEILRLSKVDALTGLGNRQFLETRMHEEALRFDRYSKRESMNLCIAFIDLDNFKYYNDTFGHHIGDEILRYFADLLRKQFRATDFIARFGGDEFIVIMTETDDFQARIPAERVIAYLAEQTELDGRIQRITGHSFAIPEGKRIACSIGLAKYDFAKYSSTDIETLLQRADQALYQAKNTGKNRVCIWGG